MPLKKPALARRMAETLPDLAAANDKSMTTSGQRLQTAGAADAHHAHMLAASEFLCALRARYGDGYARMAAAQLRDELNGCPLALRKVRQITADCCALYRLQTQLGIPARGRDDRQEKNNAGGDPASDAEGAPSLEAALDQWFAQHPIPDLTAKKCAELKTAILIKLRARRPQGAKAQERQSPAPQSALRLVRSEPQLAPREAPGQPEPRQGHRARLEALSARYTAEALAARLPATERHLLRAAEAAQLQQELCTRVSEAAQDFASDAAFAKKLDDLARTMMREYIEARSAIAIALDAGLPAGHPLASPFVAPEPGASPRLRTGASVRELRNLATFIRDRLDAALTEWRRRQRLVLTPASDAELRQNLVQAAWEQAKTPVKNPVSRLRRSVHDGALLAMQEKYDETLRQCQARCEPGQAIEAKIRAVFATDADSLTPLRQEIERQNRESEAFSLHREILQRVSEATAGYSKALSEARLNAEIERQTEAAIRDYRARLDSLAASGLSDEAQRVIARDLFNSFRTPCLLDAEGLASALRHFRAGG